MTASDFAEIVFVAGGPQALAERLKVGKDWVYRRLSGVTPIKEKDRMLIEAAMEPQQKKAIAKVEKLRKLRKAKD